MFLLPNAWVPSLSGLSMAMVGYGATVCVWVSVTVGVKGL